MVSSTVSTPLRYFYAPFKRHPIDKKKHVSPSCSCFFPEQKLQKFRFLKTSLKLWRYDVMTLHLKTFSNILKYIIYAGIQKLYKSKSTKSKLIDLY